MPHQDRRSIGKQPYLTELSYRRTEDRIDLVSCATPHQAAVDYRLACSGNVIPGFFIRTLSEFTAVTTEHYEDGTED